MKSHSKVVDDLLSSEKAADGSMFDPKIVHDMGQTPTRKKKGLKPKPGQASLLQVHKAASKSRNSPSRQPAALLQSTRILKTPKSSMSGM